MHSVCVCEYHQNVKLQLDSLPSPKLDHKSLIAKLVCDVSERNCMLHWCEKCPGSDSLREHLQSVFSERSIEEDDELTFKHWTHTDGTRLITRQELACDLLEEIVMQINALTSHSFIAKAQAAYLSQQKESLINSRHCGCFARFRRKLLICCSGCCSRLLLGQQSSYTASTSCLLSERR